MKSNLVITIFKAESEASQAFAELSSAPEGNGYSAPGAAMIKKNAAGGLDTIKVYGEDSTNNTAAGAIIGGLIGLIGGPVGALVGAAIGGFAGRMKDAEDIIDNTSIIAVVSRKIFEGEVAIAAFVEEEEPAFDAVFEKYDTTIIRYDAESIAAEVKQLKENGTEEIEQVIKDAMATPEREEKQPENAAEMLTGWRSATNRVLDE